VKTQSLLGRGIDIALGSNVLLLLPPVIADHAWVLATLGQRSEALNGIRRGEELVERHAGKGVVAQRGWAYHSLGRASLQLGNVDEALRLAQRSIDSSPHYHGFVAHTQCLLGDIKAYPDRFDADGSEVHYHQALALAEPRGMRPLIAHCRRGLGKLHARTGQRHLAQEHLTTATTMYREMGMQFWLGRAEAELRSGWSPLRRRRRLLTDSPRRSPVQPRRFLPKFVREPGDENVLRLQDATAICLGDQALAFYVPFVFFVRANLAVPKFVPMGRQEHESPLESKLLSGAAASGVGQARFRDKGRAASTAKRLVLQGCCH